MAIEKEYTLKLSTEQAQANVDELNKSLELQVNLIDEIEKELSQYEKELNKTSKTNLSARKKLNDKIKETKDRLKDEKVALKDVKKDRDDANKSLKEAKENAADYSGVLGIIDQKTGGVVSGMRNLTSSVGGATKGMNLLKVAIIGTGIGALLIAITSVAAAFKGSEEGQNKYAKLLGVIGAVVGNVVDLMADLGEVIIGLFSGDSEAIQSIKSFGKKLFDLVGLPIKNTIDIAKALGKTLGALFSGDISGAFNELKKGVSDIKENFVEANEVIIGATNSVKDFVKEQIKEGEAAAKVADMRAKADKIERKLIVDRSKLESEIAQLRLKARQEDKFSAEERKAALVEAQELENQLLDKETEYLVLRRDAQQLENTFSRTNKENLTKEAESIAAVNRQVANRANVQRQLQRELNTINNQIEADRKALADEKQKDIEAREEKERLRQAEIDKINKDIELQKENEKAETKLQKIELEKERKIKELEDLKATEEEKANIIMFYDNKILKAKEKNENDKKKLQKIRTQQTLGDAKNTFNQIAQLAGEDSKVGKAFAIASATISGVEGVQNAYTTAQESPITKVFPAYPVVSAGLAAAVAIKNIAAIKRVNPSGRGGAGTSVPTPSIPPVPPTPPDANIVGVSGTNQLAQAIGEQTQQPIQAFVVSSEVTSAQELERNTIDGASIG